MDVATIISSIRSSIAFPPCAAGPFVAAGAMVARNRNRPDTLCDAMIRYECDRCGRPLRANDTNRYIVKIEVFAAAGPLDLDEASQADPGAELEAVLEKLREADADDVEDRTYRVFRFDVCDACRKALIARPLGA